MDRTRAGHVQHVDMYKHLHPAPASSLANNPELIVSSYLSVSASLTECLY